MGNSFSCVLTGVRAIRPYRDVNEQIRHVLETKPCTRKPTSSIFANYRRTIEDIKKTTDGIVFIHNEALKFTGADRFDEFTIMLKSLQTRLLDLRNHLIKLSKLSVFKVDNSVGRRKEIARDMFVLIERFHIAIRLVDEGVTSSMLDIHQEITSLVKLTDSLFSI